MKTLRVLSSVAYCGNERGLIVARGLVDWPVRGVPGRSRVGGVPNGPMPKSRPGLEALTPKQKQVALLMLEGYWQTQIAQMLEISPSAATKRVSPIYDKFGVHSSMQFVCHYFDTIWRPYHEGKHQRDVSRARHARRGCAA